MSVTQVNYVTFTCNGPDCDKTVTFEANQEAANAAKEQNPWMNSHRRVITPDGRELSYCSDDCEIKNAGLGAHNKKQIITGATPTTVNLAAQAAERARQANQALHTGQGQVVLS